MRSPSVTTMTATSSWSRGTLREHVLEPVGVRVGEEQAPGVAPVDAAELLAGLPHHRRVDDGQQVLDVVEQHAEEEGLVLVLHLAQEHVATDVGGLQAELHAHPVGALLEGLDVGRQQAVEVEGVALLGRERGALVEHRPGEQGATPLGDGEGFGGGHGRRSGRS